MCYSCKNEKGKQTSWKVSYNNINDKSSSFDELLEKEALFSHTKETFQHLQQNSSKLGGACRNLTWATFWEKRDRYYNLRNNGNFPVWTVNTVFHETGSISFLGPKIWILPPSDLNHFDDFENFKNSSENCKAENCLRWLYKVCLQIIEFFVRKSNWDYFTRNLSNHVSVIFLW